MGGQFIKVSECRTQCSLLPEQTEFDKWFSMAIPSAELAIKNHIQAELFVDQDALSAADPAPARAFVFDASMRMATLMLIAHWFINRESASAVSVNEIPYSIEFLLKSYTDGAL